MMKTLLLVLLVAGCQCAMAQRTNDKQQVPRNVQHNFQRDYPQASDTRWSTSGNEYHADFTDRSPNDRGEMVAHYDRNGRHIDSHIPYDPNDVPSSVVNHVQKRYPGSRDHNYTRIERPGASPLFQVSMSINGKHTNKYVDDRGQERNYQDHH